MEQETKERALISEITKIYHNNRKIMNAVKDKKLVHSEALVQITESNNDLIIVLNKFFGGERL